METTLRICYLLIATANLKETSWISLKWSRRVWTLPAKSKVLKKGNPSPMVSPGLSLMNKINLNSLLMNLKPLKTMSHPATSSIHLKMKCQSTVAMRILLGSSESRMPKINKFYRKFNTSPKGQTTSTMYSPCKKPRKPIMTTSIFQKLKMSHLTSWTTQSTNLKNWTKIWVRIRKQLFKIPCKICYCMIIQTWIH